MQKKKTGIRKLDYVIYDMTITYILYNCRFMLRQQHMNHTLDESKAKEVAACGWAPLKVLLGDAQSLGDSPLNSQCRGLFL